LTVSSSSSLNASGFALRNSSNSFSSASRAACHSLYPSTAY